MWVAPKEIKYFLVIFRMAITKLDLEWSLNLFDSLNILNSWTNASMAAENSLLFISNNGSQRHLLKSFIDLGKDAIRIIDILTQSLCAFITKAEVPIDVLVFMVASKQQDLLWVLQFECKEQTYNLKTILAFVDIVSQKQVIECMDITGIGWSLPYIEESHQVDVLTMNVSNDFDWRSDLFDDDWLSSEDLSAFIG